MRPLVNFIKIVNLQTFMVIIISFVATYLCLLLDYTINLPSGLIGIAVVFPIVFSINAAYKRREEALRYFASIKAHAVALFFAHRDWTPQDQPEHAQRMKQILSELLQVIHKYCAVNRQDDEQIQIVYDVFSRLSQSMEELRANGVTTSEISRANQYMRGMMIDFERMRNIHLYRTPTTLRAYSQVFLNVFPILFAPYFAYLSTQHLISSGFLVAIMYSLILVSLDNIQEDLENPYDGIGEDDLNLNVAGQYQQILAVEMSAVES